MYCPIPVPTYIAILKRVAKHQHRTSSGDKQTACLDRIAKHAGFQNWVSLKENLHHPYPGGKVLAEHREKIVRGLPKAVPQAIELYVRLEALESLNQLYFQEPSTEDLFASGLEPIDVYEEVLVDLEVLLPKATLTKLIPDLERNGVWGRVEDIMIDEFSMSDW